MPSPKKDAVETVAVEETPEPVVTVKNQSSAESFVAKYGGGPYMLAALTAKTEAQFFGQFGSRDDVEQMLADYRTLTK